jgi:hypothetical protein
MLGFSFGARAQPILLAVATTLLLLGIGFGTFFAS